MTDGFFTEQGNFRFLSILDNNSTDDSCSLAATCICEIVAQGVVPATESTIPVTTMSSASSATPSASATWLQDLENQDRLLV